MLKAEVATLSLRPFTVSAQETSALNLSLKRAWKKRTISVNQSDRLFSTRHMKTFLRNIIFNQDYNL